jgi:hypothetical protein
MVSSERTIVNAKLGEIWKETSVSYSKGGSVNSSFAWTG